MGHNKEQMMKNFSKKSFEMMGKTVGLAKYKFIKHAIPQLKPDGLNATFLPINQDIEVPDSNVLPITYLYQIIERASHRVIVDFCPCRTAMDCKQHSKDIGCLMMGQGALDIDPSMGHEASVEEAKAHADKAIKDGLVPLVGKSLVENMVFGISKPNRDRFFVACFCCECCCLSRFLEPMSPDLRKENLKKIEGLQVEVGDACIGCGHCAERCFMKAISIKDGKAAINDGCLGCGRCATICSQKAIKISIHNSRFVEEIQQRIAAVVDIK